MTENREVLSALIDREPVDPDALARALDEPAARALLVDFVRLRAALIEGEDVEPALPAARSRDGSPTRSWARAAAVLLAAAGLGSGVWLGTWLAEDRPPAPARVVHFEPGVDWQ